MRVLNKVKKLGKKKILGIILVALILCTAGILLVRSNSTTESAVSVNQTVAVQRGDLTIDITAVGNLALSVKEDLAFEIPGRVEEITVEEILVEEGDSVEKGQLLAKLDTLEWNDMLRVLERDLLQAEISLENAKRALDDAEEGTLTQIDTDDGIRVVEIVDDWEVEIKEMQLKLAEARFEDDLKALREALEESPGIIAPFDGFITKVNIEGGDEILTGKVAVELADPNKFEADILVSEMDIMQVKLGGEAWVQVDAIQGMSLPAKVTRISPTATIQSGVVNYEVKVELEPLEAVIQEQQQARQAAVERIAQGELPERLQQAVDEGRLTREQAEEMMKQMQPEQGGQPGQAPMVIPEDFQLREGLTVTVSLIVEEGIDVLLVPNSAITTRGGQTYVQVMSADGTVEERTITTGISDWQYTEVTDGLSEDEQVVVPQGTATTTTTQQGGSPRGMFIPGMGRPRR